MSIFTLVLKSKLIVGEGNMYFYNVSVAIKNLFSSGRLKDILLNIDRLGNALSGGKATNTISARVGYHYYVTKSVYWEILAVIINHMFEPLDGQDHCGKAWLDAGRQHHADGSDKAKFLLSWFILYFYFLAAFLVRVYVLVVPSKLYDDAEPPSIIKTLVLAIVGGLFYAYCSWAFYKILIWVII